MLLRKTVARSRRNCSWCKYPIVDYSSMYMLTVGDVPLGPVFCNERCGEIEARVSKRGPVEARYQ